MGASQSYTARLLIGCPDRPGIVAAVSGFLFEQGANIVSSHQYSSDPTGGRFFMRTELFLEGLGGVGEVQARPVSAVGDDADGGPDDGGGGSDVTGSDVTGSDVMGSDVMGTVVERRDFERRFATEVADLFEMNWRVRYWGERQKIAILVSRRDHCLIDLLWRWRRGELDGDVVAVISNHEDLRTEVEAVGVPFHHVPVDPEDRTRAEARMLELLDGSADLLVLARYMQILSGEFLDRVGMPAINIHHSFLPAFAGADPYRRARERGVKLIGATAHYVTAELDGGPIIDQHVVRVDHRQTVADLERIGRDVERLVLARAVALHLDDRVIVDGRRTVVF